MGYIVVKDTREQQGWDFTKNEFCDGMSVNTLPTGDYSIVGYEDKLTIERKGTTGEFARNLVEARFENELARMQQFPHAFVILEFDMSDILSFPKNSGVPIYLWPKIRTKPYFLLKRLIELQLLYNTKVILAGAHGKDIASSIFKRVVEIYGRKEE